MRNEWVASGRQSIRAAQAEVHIGFEKAALVAAVKALAAQRHAHELAAVQAGGNGVGELDFAASARLLGFERGHHIGREDVAPHHAPVGGGFFRPGLFDDFLNRQRPDVGLRRADDAVLVHLRQRHLFQREHGLPFAAVQFGHLRQRALGRSVNQIIGQQHGKRLVVLQQLGRAQHGMPQPQGLRLAHVKALDVRRDHVAHALQRLEFAFGLQLGFEFGAAVEIIDDGVFAAASHEDQRVNAGLYGLDSAS